MNTFHSTSTRRWHLAAALAAAGLAASCDREPAAPEPSAPPASAPASKETAGGGAPTQPAVGIGAAKPEAAAAAKEALEAAGKEGAAAAKEAGDAAVEAVKDLAAAADPDVTVEQVKEMAATASPESLQGLGDKLLAAIQDKDGILKGLRAQVEQLGAGDLTKVVSLKKELQSANDLLKVLKEKLQIVADKLKASGIDVSKYTAFLGG